MELSKESHDSGCSRGHSIPAFWWFDYIYPDSPFFILLIGIGLMSCATTRFWINTSWCGVCVNNRRIPQGAQSYKFGSVGQRQAQHAWSQDSSLPLPLCSTGQATELEWDWGQCSLEFQIPPTSSDQHTSALKTWAFQKRMLLSALPPYALVLTNKTFPPVQMHVCSLLHTLTTCVQMCAPKCLHKHTHKYTIPQVRICRKDL